MLLTSMVVAQNAYTPMHSQTLEYWEALQAGYEVGPGCGNEAVLEQEVVEETAASRLTARYPTSVGAHPTKYDVETTNSLVKMLVSLKNILSKLNISDVRHCTYVVVTRVCCHETQSSRAGIGTLERGK